MFITFEGADGSGKSTQIDYAKDYLVKTGFEVITTRDPGGTNLGLKLREILLNYDGKISTNAELFIFLADRAQHVDTKIKPLLEQNKIVICDRYIDSTIAYQGYGRGLSIPEIQYLNRIVTSSLLPDLTLLFDVSTEVSMQRVTKAGSRDRMESEQVDFHKKVSDGYRRIAQESPDRIKVINANLSIDDVRKQVESILDFYVINAIQKLSITI